MVRPALATSVWRVQSGATKRYAGPAVGNARGFRTNLGRRYRSPWYQMRTFRIIEIFAYPEERKSHPQTVCLLGAGSATSDYRPKEHWCFRAVVGITLPNIEDGPGASFGAFRGNIAA